MKKLNFILLMVIFLLTVPFIESHAQFVLNNAHAFTDDGAITLSKIPAGSSATVNQKAEKNFKKDYQLASGTEWSVLSNKTLMARFYIDNTLYRAFYSPNGNWMYTISGYDGKKLDSGVADKIKSLYYNSSITYVNQIDLVNAKPFYIVEIQDSKSISKIRVNDDDIEVVEKYAKY
jgi:hypothetical protein